MSNQPNRNYNLDNFDEADQRVIIRDIQIMEARRRQRQLARQRIPEAFFQPINPIQPRLQQPIIRQPIVQPIVRRPIPQQFMQQQAPLPAFPSQPQGFQQSRLSEETRKRTGTAEEPSSVRQRKESRPSDSTEGGPSTSQPVNTDVDPFSSSRNPPDSSNVEGIPEEDKEEDEIEHARGDDMEPTLIRNQKSMQEVLVQAAAHARKEEHFQVGTFGFYSLAGHILESSCKHEDGVECLRCKYDAELQLAELPEMVFPRNTLTIRFLGSSSFIEFNCLDALKLVSLDLPDVKVGASVVWQSARRERLQQITEQHKPFDWTYTTHYKGTVHGCKVEPSTERIDMDRLKRRDQILFSSSVTLFEDELADHGIAQLSARIRVMDAGYFFVLLRFYMRVDNVLFRVCDTRIVGNTNDRHVIREWQLREAKNEQVFHVDPEVLLDVDRAWMHLPVIEEHVERISVDE